MAQIKANGIDIEFESLGRADDPAVLLIGGIYTQLTWWHDSLCHGFAARGFRVIRFDNRDAGKSTHGFAPVWARILATTSRSRAAFRKEQGKEPSPPDPQTAAGMPGLTAPPSVPG